MIDFHCKTRHKDMTPIVKDTDIQEYAETLLQDYKPKLLQEPGKINPTHFVESYLEAVVDYQDIYYPENAPAIAGATVFNDDRILVFDREEKRIKPIDVAANTVLIDNSTMDDGKEGFATFTVLHEGGHLCLHPAVYRRMGGQLSFFDNHKDGDYVVCCRRSSLEGGCSKRSKLTTQEEFREHQANVFAASIAMPRPTFVPAAQELIRKCGFKDGVFVMPPVMDWDYNLGVSAIEEALSGLFGVSKAAANVQMKRLGLLMSEEKYLEQHRQLAVAF